MFGKILETTELHGLVLESGRFAWQTSHCADGYVVMRTRKKVVYLLCFMGILAISFYDLIILFPKRIEKTVIESLAEFEINNGKIEETKIISDRFPFSDAGFLSKFSLENNILDINGFKVVSEYDENKYITEQVMDVLGGGGWGESEIYFTEAFLGKGTICEDVKCEIFLINQRNEYIIYVYSN